MRNFKSCRKIKGLKSARVMSEPPSRFNNTNTFTSSTGENYSGFTVGVRHAF